MITGLFNTLAALQVVALLTAIGIVSFAVWQRHHSAMSVRRGGDGRQTSVRSPSPISRRELLRLATMLPLSLAASQVHEIKKNR
jgi:hypothetical protein